MSPTPRDRSFSRTLLRSGLIWTGILEGVTLFFRFGLDLQSTRDTATTVGPWTGGLRIHHGYIGFLALIAGWFLLARYPRGARLLLIAGIALVASDLIHHFLVLWPWTGSPQFDWKYPI